MNYFAVKSTASGARLTSSPLRFAMFHSTPALDRKRRSCWDSAAATGSSSKKRFNYYSKRQRKIESKQVLLRNVSAYAERLFQSWKTGSNKADPSSKGKSWFRDSSGYSGSKKHSYHPPESEWQSYRSKRQGTVNFVFCDESDDEEVETIFRSAFKGAQFSFWSSNEEARFSWRNSSSDFCDEETYTFEDDYDGSSRDKKSRLHSKDLASDLQALGLSTTSLELEKVKKAYRACALKWHPDRHQGFAKVAAEEKFKRCSAAYQSLCDRLEGA